MSLALYLFTATALIAFFARRIPRASAIALILLPITFTGRALLTGRVYAPIDLGFAYEPLKSHVPGGVGQAPAIVPYNIALSDLYSQIIPWQKAVRYALAQGEWPLWNPFVLCGDILAAAAQPAVYDPFQLLGLLLPLPHALTFGASITFFLAGFFTYLFARHSGRGEVASLVAASAFMFSGMMAFFVGWPLGRAWAFLPLVLLGVRHVVREGKAGVLLCGLVLVIVAGHPESVLHVVAAGVAYGLFELVSCRAQRGIPRGMGSLASLGMTLVRALGAGVVALLLTAIYLLPFAEASSQTLEHEIRTKLYANARYDQLASPERQAHRLGRTFLPAFDGEPWNSATAGATAPQWDPLSARVGSIVLALAIGALLVAPRRAETWFFFALAIVCLFLTFGSWPFAHALHAVPLFDIAINERFAFVAVFAMAMLAAITVDALRPRIAFAVIGVGIALAIAATLTNTRTHLLAELLPLAAIALLLLFRWRYTALAILALVLIQRTIEDGGIYPSLPRSMFYPRVAVLDGLPAGDRIVGIGSTLLPNTSAMFEREDARGYEAMTNKRLSETYPLWSRFQRAWFNAVDDPSRPFLSFLNVRYALDGTRVLENKSVLPRAFVPPRVRYEHSGEAVLAAMQTATNFAEQAWIEADVDQPHDASNGPGTVAIRRDGLAWDLEADMQGGGWIVMSETNWKGWRAYIDGKRVRTRFANHAFIGVHVPAGRHRVRLVYLPESFTRGRTITFLTLAALAIGYAVARLRGSGRDGVNPNTA